MNKKINNTHHTYSVSVVLAQHMEGTFLHFSAGVNTRNESIKRNTFLLFVSSLIMLNKNRFAYFFWFLTWSVGCKLVDLFEITFSHANVKNNTKTGFDRAIYVIYRYEG